MLKKYFSFFIATALALSSCSDDSFDPVLQPSDAPVLTSPTEGSTYVLTEDTQDDIFSIFEWTAANFGFQSATTYTLQMDVAGNDFSAPAVLGSSTKLTLEDITNGQVNNVLTVKELDADVEHVMELRVIAEVGDAVDPLISAPVSITITPYAAFVEITQLQVPGSYQGWAPENDSTVIFSRKGDLKYEGYIYFPDDGTEFKYTDGPSWDVNWGDTGADGTLDPDGDNIVAGDAGVYKLNVDINALTHEYTPTKWGIIGDATPTGWDADTDLDVDPATGIMSITMDLVVGEIKFRANDAWDIDFGDNGGNGSLEYGGDNIAIGEAGNYTIELILNEREKYTYTITKN